MLVTVVWLLNYKSNALHYSVTPNSVGDFAEKGSFSKNKVCRPPCCFWAGENAENTQNIVYVQHKPTAAYSKLWCFYSKLYLFIFTQIWPKSFCKCSSFSSGWSKKERVGGRKYCFLLSVCQQFVCKDTRVGLFFIINFRGQMDLEPNTHRCCCWSEIHFLVPLSNKA